MKLKVRVIGKSVIYSRNGRNSWINIICLIEDQKPENQTDEAFQFVVDREVGEEAKIGKVYDLVSDFVCNNGKIDSKIIDLI